MGSISLSFLVHPIGARSHNAASRANKCRIAEQTPRLLRLFLAWKRACSALKGRFSLIVRPSELSFQFVGVIIEYAETESHHAMDADGIFVTLCLRAVYP